MALIARIAWRNLWRNRRRTLLMLGAIVVSLLGVLFFVSFYNGYLEQMKDNAVSTLTGHVKIRHARFADNPLPRWNVAFDEARLSAVRAAPGCAGASARVIGSAMAGTAERSETVTVIGALPKAEPSVSIVPGSVTRGRWLEDSDERAIVVGEAFLKRFDVRLGRRVVLMAYDTTGEIASQVFRIVGAYKTNTLAFDRSTLYIGLADAQALFATPGRVTEIVALARAADDAPALAAAVEPLAAGADETVRTWRDIDPILGAMIDFSYQSLALFNAIFYIAMAFGIANTFLMIVHERTRELGVMSALGVARRTIVGMLLTEAAWLAAAGGAIGVAAGGALTAWLGARGMDLSRWGEGMEMLGMSGVIRPFLRTGDVSSALVTTLVVSMLMSLYPAWKAGRVRPVIAIRME